jgi:hypothetical protein
MPDSSFAIYAKLGEMPHIGLRTPASMPREFRPRFLDPHSTFLSNHVRKCCRDEVEKYPDAGREMLPVDTNREEGDLFAPKVFETFNQRACLQVRLNVPSRYQRNSSSGLYPVMDNQAARCCQVSANFYFEWLVTVLERPRVHHPPGSDQADAVVSLQILRPPWSAVAFQVGRRGADNIPCSQNFLRDDTRIRWETNPQGYIQSVIDDIQTCVR